VKAGFALLLVLLLPGLADDFRRELNAADPPGRVKLLENLPRRLAEEKPAARKAVATVLLKLLADSDRARLHAACLSPLVATEAQEAIGAVVVRAYAPGATPLRAAARHALATAGGPAVTHELARQMGLDASARARAWLALFLGRRGDARAGPALVRALADPDRMVRGAAAEALTRIWRKCRGFEAGAWKRAIEAPPPPVPDPNAPVTPSKPGETVTKPAPPPDPDEAVAKLAPVFFGVKLDRPLVVIVLDFSGSIRGEAARGVRGALREALDLLPTTRRVTVLAFDDRLFTFGKVPAAMDPDAKLRLRDFLSDLPPGKRTELLVPIRSGLAFAAKHGPDGAQVLIVSDGQPTSAGPTLDAIVSQVKALAGRDVRVDAAVYGGRKVGLFSWLATETKGRVVKLPELR